MTSLDDQMLDPSTATAAATGTADAASDTAAEPDPDSHPLPQNTQAKPAEPHFPTVHAFVSGFLVKVYARKFRDQDTSFKWCAQWFHHAEAVCRLEALWKAFEALRTDPGTGASVWWRDHADPCMTALTAPDGPFAKCGPDRHQTPPELPTDDPPPGLFTHD
jgi:Domain of unknown function (DUF4913)